MRVAQCAFRSFSFGLLSGPTLYAPASHDLPLVPGRPQTALTTIRSTAKLTTSLAGQHPRATTGRGTARLPQRESLLVPATAVGRKPTASIHAIETLGSIGSGR